MPEYKQAALIDTLSIDLDEEQENQLSWWIASQKEAISYDREEFLERQKRYLFSFDDFITFTRKGPWDNSSNIHTPLTSITVKSYHSRLYNIFTQEDATQFLPREEMDDAKVDILKKLRNWYVWDHINEYRGLKGVANEMFYDLTTVGFGIILKSWESKQRKTIVIEQKELEKEFNQFASEAEEAKSKDKKVSVKPYKEIEKIITAYEGTMLKTVPFENIYFTNEIPENSNMDYPNIVIIIDEMNASELRKKAKLGIWSKEKVEQVIAESTGTDAARTREQNIKELRDRLTGYDSQNSYYDKRRWEIEVVFCSYDIDDDGIEEELVVYRSQKGTIIHVSYLDQSHPSGRRPIYKFDCFTKPRQAYSRGVPEFLYSLNEEMDMDHNLRLDYLQLQTCPFGVYRGGSSLDNQPIRIAPGKFIPVDEVTDLRPITFNSNATLFAGEEDRLWKYAEWLTSVSPLSQGMVPQQVGPLRSTSGVVSLLQQMDKQFRPMVDQIAQQWKKMEQGILEDLDLRVDPMFKIRVLGPSVDENVISQEEVKELAVNMLLTKSFDMKIDVASVINSDEVRQNQASVLFQSLSAPSLLQQVGIIGPKALYQIAHDYLKAWGKEPDKYIDKPDVISKPLTLWQEIQICVQGEIPPMSMQDDHEAKVQGLQEFPQTPEFQEAMQKGIYDMNVMDKIAQAVQKHQALAEALQAQAGPNLQGDNQQSNAQLQSGQSEQQGGQSPSNTTGREAPPPAEASAAPGGQQ